MQAGRRSMMAEIPVSTAVIGAGQFRLRAQETSVEFGSPAMLPGLH
jgi:hypothetical protein